MQNSKKLELESHLLRIKNMIDGWSLAERCVRSENFKIQLIDLGIPIDEDIQNKIDKFNHGAIGFDEFAKFFMGKIN